MKRIATVAIALGIGACSSNQAMGPSNDEAKTVLKDAIARALGDKDLPAGVCIYTGLERPRADEPRVGNVRRIEPEWLPKGALTTPERFGCGRTLALSNPYFARGKYFGYAKDLSVEINRYCGPICGDREVLLFRRTGWDGKWTYIGKLRAGMY